MVWSEKIPDISLVESEKGMRYLQMYLVGTEVHLLCLQGSMCPWGLGITASSLHPADTPTRAPCRSVAIIPWTQYCGLKTVECSCHFCLSTTYGRRALCRRLEELPWTLPSCRKQKRNVNGQPSYVCSAWYKLIIECRSQAPKSDTRNGPSRGHYEKVLTVTSPITIRTTSVGYLHMHSCSRVARHVRIPCQPPNEHHDH
jgi:hypothetical protein